MSQDRRTIEDFLSHESAIAFRKAFPTVLGEGKVLPTTASTSNGQKSLVARVDLTGDATPIQIKEIIKGLLLSIGYDNAQANGGVLPLDRVSAVANAVYSAYVSLFKEKLQEILKVKQEAFIAIGTLNLDMFDDHLIVLDELKAVYDALGHRMGDALAYVQRIIDVEDQPSYGDKCDYAEQFVKIAEELAPDQHVRDLDAQITDSLIESLELLTHKSLGDDFHHLIDG